MPSYFFRYANGVPIIEADPLILENETEALSEANLAAVDIWAEGKRLGEDRSHWRVEVYDDADHLLFTVPFSEALESS